MIRTMTQTETKYVKIVNKNNQINTTPIICRFSTVERFLTALEIRACILKGALVSEITSNGLRPLSLDTYNKIKVNEPATETPVTEEVVDETTETVKSEEPVVDETTETVKSEEPVVEETTDTTEDKQTDPYDTDNYGAEFIND